MHNKEEKMIKYIKGGKVWQAGQFINADIRIEGTKITDISPTLEIKEPAAEMIDAKGLVVVPAFVDLHVHFREPGFSYKETIKTGSEAAAAGGYRLVCTMPNLNPAPDNIENLQKQLDIIKKDAVIEVIPFATITTKRMGKEPIDYVGMAPYVAGFSDDGSGVQNEEVMQKCMEEIAKTGKILSAHCEVDSLLNGGYIHKGRYAEEKGHRGISSESEWKEVERDIRLAEETGCRLHVCHISTKESVDLIRRAKSRGVKVTCETGPHYLTFCDEDLKEEGRFKMNPPIRSREDRDSLRLGLIDGTIDAIATDHAPHSESEKSRGLEKSAMGVVGLETAFPAVFTTMVKSGLMPFERLVETMALTPAKILDPNAKGPLQPGTDADIVLLDLDGETEVETSRFKSLGKATPYEGMKLKGKVVMNLFKGEKVG